MIEGKVTDIKEILASAFAFVLCEWDLKPEGPGSRKSFIFVIGESSL